MPPQLLGVPPYYNASAIIGGSAANRVTPHLLGVPPRTLFAAEWCMVRATAKQNILGGGERHSPIITLLPPPPILSPARDTAPFRAICSAKLRGTPKITPHSQKLRNPHHSPTIKATYHITPRSQITIPPPPAAEPPSITVEPSAAEPPSLTHDQSLSVKNTIKKGRHNVTTLYIKYGQTLTLFNS